MRDFKRLSVALTRAKKMLVIMGTESYLKEIDIFRKVIEKIKEMGGVHEVHNFD